MIRKLFCLFGKHKYTGDSNIIRIETTNGLYEFKTCEICLKGVFVREPEPKEKKLNWKKLLGNTNK